MGIRRSRLDEVLFFPMAPRTRPPSLPPPAGPEGSGRSELLLYTTPDHKTPIEVRLEDETVWLTQRQLSELFQKSVPTINEHIRNVFAEGELDAGATIRKSRIVQDEGGRQVTRDVDFYNLDVIISVGYRVKSHRGTQFRIWATQRLREYLVKGFALDDERLKEVRTLPGGRNYFDELLERIRDIRSSERRFYQKICDIVGVAKNYLAEPKLRALNLLVDQYLSFANFKAPRRKPMAVKDWTRKLDELLKLNERDILADAGHVSRELAM